MLKMQVRKRDGRLVSWDRGLITRAIVKAMQEINYTNSEIANIVSGHVEGVLITIGNEIVDISNIVELVELTLMESYPEVGNAYITFRRQRDIARAKNSDMVKNVLGVIENTDDSVMLENANKAAEIIPTMRDLVAGAVSKQIARDHILPSHITNAHDKGEIHYHDLDYAPAFPLFNCMLVNLEEMFTNGFKMGNAEIETPRSISTACSITAQIIAQVASHIYGGTSLDRLDIVLAPYVTASYAKHLQCAYDWNIEKAEEFAEARTEKECFDAFQALEYEVNTLHTANGQTPFVTFAFGRGTSWESRLIQQSILRNRINGLGKHHKTATFPKLVFYVEDCINRRKDDPNHDIKRLALECSSRRMYPDYLNVEALKRVTGSVKAPMGCRSFLGQWDDADGNEVHDGRNNLGVVSLNLVRIAIESGGDFVKFWELMRKRTELVHEALETRIDRLRGVKAKVAPVLYCEGAMGVRLDPEDEVMQLFENGRASISMGYIGLCEVAHAMFGAGPETDHAASEFCKDVVKFMKQKVDDWKAESGFGYSLYATPSENLCDRFCRIDREQFGVIEGVNDKEYYTNSFHTDVQYKTDPFTKFDLESVYPPFSSGGFISYAEFPSMLHNIDGLELVLDHTRDHNPYVAFNTPTDDCYLCGWSGETKVGAKGFECPNCGNRDLSKMSVIRRVCGYLGGERGVNHGKLEEMRRRVKHV